MKGFVFIGRGGQGVKSAAHMLGVAGTIQGLFIQAFPEYGPERIGAPVKAYVKLDNKRIRSFDRIHNPNYVILVDDSLINLAIPLLNKDNILIINSDKSSDYYKEKYNINSEIITINASKISLDIIGLNKPNVPVLGVIAKISDLITLNSLINAVMDYFKSKHKDAIGLKNKIALKKAYDEVIL